MVSDGGRAGFYVALEVRRRYDMIDKGTYYQVGRYSSSYFKPFDK